MKQSMKKYEVYWWGVIPDSQPTPEEEVITLEDRLAEAYGKTVGDDLTYVNENAMMISGLWEEHVRVAVVDDDGIEVHSESINEEKFPLPLVWGISKFRECRAFFGKDAWYTILYTRKNDEKPS